MLQDDAVKMARKMDLTAKAGTWFLARERSDGWVVVRVDGETDKERVVHKRPTKLPT